MSGKLVIFSAPSGSGKTTIVKKMIEQEELKLKFSVSACSRKKRENETHGKDYFFLSIEEFKKSVENNEFAEWEEVYENMFYGTLKNEIQRITDSGFNAIFDVDVAGALSIKKIYGNNAISIFVMPPSIQELEKRLRLRSSETEESIKRRISKAEYELAFSNKFDKIVINDKLNIAIKESKNIIKEFIC
jgi:guanylate kinase